MTTFYVDSSAWAKLLLDEPESESVVAWVDERLAASDILVSSQLLVTELHRLAQREGVAPTAVGQALSVLGGPALTRDLPAGRAGPRIDAVARCLARHSGDRGRRRRFHQLRHPPDRGGPGRGYSGRATGRPAVAAGERRPALASS